MPEIKPFRGIRYNTAKIKNYADVVCQPYDQITDEMEKYYKNRSPNNFVRLVLTKYAEGHERQKEYQDAKKFTDQWLNEKIFVQDEKTAIYPYWQEFSAAGKNYLRKGLMCLVKIEELGKGNILPHEKTLAKPKEDRLSLLRATKKDFEPVFLLYTDPKNYVNDLLQKACQGSAMVDVKDDKNVTHKLWRIADTNLIDQITKFLKDVIFVIADGHHRYETAFTYRNELADIDNNHPANYKLITLVNIEDAGLVILPTHRLIKNLKDFNLDSFLKRAQEFFQIEKTDQNRITADLNKAKSQAFGFYNPQGAYVLKLKSTEPMKKILADRSKEYQGLDVAILHTLLIEKILDITPTDIENHVKYERGVEETMKKVDAGEFQFCFLMNPTRAEQVKQVAQNKERMPQKSTDFYPKLISGLVFYDIAG